MSGSDSLLHEWSGIPRVIIHPVGMSSAEPFQRPKLKRNKYGFTSPVLGHFSKSLLTGEVLGSSQHGTGKANNLSQPPKREERRNPVETMLFVSIFWRFSYKSSKMVIKKALSPCSPGRFKRGITIHNYKRL